MPVSRNAHHNQFPATPLVRTMFVTRFGVSVLNVVATIDTPMSHHGAARPDVKNSAVLEPARRASTTAGMNETTMESATMIQSRDVRRTSRDWGLGTGDWGNERHGSRQGGIGSSVQLAAAAGSRRRRFAPLGVRGFYGFSSSVRTSNGWRSTRCGCAATNRVGI